MTPDNQPALQTLQEMFAVCANERRMKEADAIAYAIESLRRAEGATPVPGWVMVPEDPDETMLHTAFAFTAVDEVTLRRAYMVMVDARPNNGPAAEGATLGEGRELRPDFANALPGGALDLSTFQEIENALDAADAPMQVEGKWLTLPQRIAAMCEAPQRGGWISADDVRRHVRTIDVALNGEEGAAKQASLCDIASQVAHEYRTGGPILARATPTAQRVAAGGDGMFAKEESSLRKIARENFGPGWLIHACETAADAIASLRTSLASQIEITNTERAQAERLAAKSSTPPPTGEAVVKCPECMSSGVLYECVACSATNYPAAQAEGRGVALAGLVARWKDSADSEWQKSRDKQWAEWVRDRHHSASQTLQLCADELQRAIAVPNGIRSVERGFEYDAIAKCHIPTVTVRFSPAPADHGDERTSWDDRDALAAALTAPADAASQEHGHAE